MSFYLDTEHQLEGLKKKGTIMVDSKPIVKLSDGSAYRAYAPHCDARVLHAPNKCRYCDHYKEWQQAREVWGINFTGEEDPEKLPCPSTTERPLSKIEEWPGNRAAPGL